MYMQHPSPPSQPPVEPLWHQVRRANMNPQQILDWLGVVAPPIPIEQIVLALGVRVEAIPYEPPMLFDEMGHMSVNPAAVQNPLSGSASFDSATGMAIIAVNRGENARRQRFTLAHELGHLLLHPLTHHHRDTRYQPGTSLWEQQANRFAAEILMPAQMVRLMTYHSAVDTEQMARVFDVSPVAMAIRLREVV